MKSKTQEITIRRRVNVAPSAGLIPPFVSLIHRHFEKSPPSQGKVNMGIEEFVGPVDLIRLVAPNSAENISKIVLGYKKGTVICPVVM